MSCVAPIKRVGVTALALFAFPLFAVQTTIDCGSATDSNFTGGTAYTAVAVAPPGTVVDLTVRYGPQFSYTFPAANVAYVVTFHFLETTVQGPGQRVFSVSVNNQEIITNLDVFATAGFMTPMTRSAVVFAADQLLTVTFTASVRNAMVAAIDFNPLFQPLAAAAQGIINSKCTRCHGDTGPPADTFLTFDRFRKEVGDLDLRTRAAMLQGGSRGPAIVPGNGAASLIYRFTSFVPAMPPTLADVAKENAADARGLLSMPPGVGQSASASPSMDVIDTFASLSPTWELTPQQLAILKLWIDVGAPTP
jgi:hypothetical protein